MYVDLGIRTKMTMIPVLLICTTVISSVLGHGRLMDPPARASLWRFSEFQKFNPPTNYNDHELFCGGYFVHHFQNGGKCGECGDAWHLVRPRPNEGGGHYGRGIISRNYTSGQVIDVIVELTVSHLGHFEFRLCPHNNPKIPVEQSCLDKYLLPLANGSGTKYPILTSKVGLYRVQLVLPAGISCDHCVFQWEYRAGNSWGLCDNGTGKLGCGPQETFKGCSDVRILKRKRMTSFGNIPIDF